MFDRILIANRGEIACRVIDTAKARGVSTVAVYSDADRTARHVAMADLAVHIGGAAPADSYLNGDRVIAAALETGAQAIHPGYGFLSENPEFVEAVEAAGLVFIGPSAGAIRAMGLKDAAKALMQDAGVPVVPGYHGDTQDPDHLSGAADGIGYPVLIKAVAGGGGKGMRRVDDAADFADQLAAAQREAQSAFGNPAVLIEKYIEQPRHIEVQVFGDGTDAIHLYERDCSLQRRHQKVIEEAPAPGMTAEMRAAMGDAAVRAAKAIGYAGAGTVEFIVDGANGLRPDGFWFMEMNTRLQVEHPVTEAVTGLDLVAWQLRVAAGEPLPMHQQDVPLTGHAFEARLYAEDVPAGFLPATGTLSHLSFPATARIDSGVRAGDAISPFYDPMIAKVVTHGPTRAVALKKLAAALDATEVVGCVTNLSFLGALARHAGFTRGEVDTGLIARDLDALTAVPPPSPARLAQAALAATDTDTNTDALTGFTLWAPLWRTITLEIDGQEITARVARTGPDTAEIEVAGTTVTARNVAGWTFDGTPAAASHTEGGTVTLFGPDGVSARVLDPLDRAAADASGSDIIEAPMPGMLARMLVAAGDSVSAGQKLAVLEAMKMEHALTAPRDAVVAEVLVPEGTQIEAHAPLIRFAGDDA
ncbi:MAG: 3-methylcrotonyl-CoA carboxylase [Maritimibacter sp.]|nr:3-methylcrotonyl-CoA carboxylase [Maritimibacter sp.]